MDTEKVTRIDVAKDFSPTPEILGRYSAQEFRRTLVDPRLDKGEHLIIELGNAVGFTSSFFEEVFGGLVRKYGYEFVNNHVSPLSHDHNWHRVKQARKFMDEANMEETMMS